MDGLYFCGVGSHPYDADKVAQELDFVLEETVFVRGVVEVGGLDCRKHVPEVPECRADTRSTISDSLLKVAFSKMPRPESSPAAVCLWDRPLLAASTFLVLGATSPLLTMWLRNLTSH